MHSTRKAKRCLFPLMVGLLFCLVLMPLGLVGQAEAQDVPKRPRGSGSVTVEADDHEYRTHVVYREWTIHNKDCSTTVMYYYEYYEDLWVSKKTKGGSVEWELVRSSPAKYVFSGSLTGSVEYKFSGPLGSGTVIVPLTVTFSAELDETGVMTSIAFVESGPSFDLRNGLAETGPWTVTPDPTEPITGGVDFEAGEFAYELVYLFDCPNVKVEGGLIPFEENVTGTITMPVGGIWAPVDKLGLLAPYIGLAVAVVTVTIGIVYSRKRWLGKAVVQRL